MPQEYSPDPSLSLDLPPEYEKYLEPRRRLTDTELRESFKHETWILNGKQIEFYGVTHALETLKVYGSELQQGIARAPLVVLESMPKSSGELENAIKIIVETLKSINITLGRSEVDWKLVEKLLSRDSFLPFFTQVEKWCRDYGKTVALTDAQSPGKFLQNIRANAVMHKQNAKIRLYKIFAGMGGLGLAALEEALRRHAPDSTPEGLGQSGVGRFARRNFFKLAGGVAAAGALGSLLQSNKNSSHGRSSDRPFSVLVYDYLDFRDVVVAEGLDRLTKQEQCPESLAVIYGMYHSDGIKHYCQSPKERILRLKAYSPIIKELKGIEPTLRQLRYNYQIKDWEVTGSEPLVKVSE